MLTKLSPSFGRDSFFIVLSSGIRNLLSTNDLAEGRSGADVSPWQSTTYDIKEERPDFYA